MPGTVEEPARRLGKRQEELVPQWEVAQVEELFGVRVRPEFGQLEVVVKGWMKKQLFLAVGSCWWIL